MTRKTFKSILACLFLSFSICGCSSEDEISTNGNNGGEQTPVTHFSGTWVTNVGSPVLFSKAAIEKCVATCKEYHISNIFMCVLNKGRTLYPSKVMKDVTGIEQMEDLAGRDPLKEMIEAAHKSGIKVHAWLEYGFAAAHGKLGEILERHPTWASKDQAGNILVRNNFYWMNPFMPEVQDFMSSLVAEIVKNYDIDGIQGDDRMPALPSEGGYDEYTVNLYKAEHNGTPPPLNTKDEAWIEWRCNKLSQYMARLYQEVKAIRATVIVSSAPGIYPWGKKEYLQDWPKWLKDGYLDYVIPQVYRTDIAQYRSTLTQQANAVQGDLKKKVYVGLMIKNDTYTPSEAFLKSMIEANRSNSITGECFWYYDGLQANDAFFKTYQ